MKPDQQPAQANSNIVLRFLCSSFLFCGLVWALWPFYRYYVDPDAISYLTLVKSYLASDWHQAVNAYWSPMGCWLTAVWVKYTGWELFASAIFVNAAGALATLLIGQALFNRFRKDNLERWCFAVSTAFFWAYVVYVQSFTDVWQCFFLLSGLLILLKKNFEQKPVWWIIVGILGALSYFSKAYSFYFFPVMIILVTGMKMVQQKDYRLKKHILITVVTIIVMLVFAFPWIYLLHEKYGIWTSSTAGTLNLSWQLEGTQNMSKNISVLLPPPYPTSLFYFEDPLLVQGHFVHFWDSPVLFLKFIVRIGFNALQWITSCNRLSAFYFFTWLFCVLCILQKKKLFFEKQIKILTLIFLVFPLPYWMLTFDNGRYLWFTVPLSMILGLVIFERVLWIHFNKWSSKIFVLVFFLSFLITPVLDLKTHFRAGAAEFEMAQDLKQLDIKGSFVSNLSYENGKEVLHFIAWFSGNPWYCHALNQFSTQEILQDAKRYHVKYYFYFYQGTGADYQLKDQNGNAYLELTHGTIPGMKVFYLGF